MQMQSHRDRTHLYVAEAFYARSEVGSDIKTDKKKW